jgi:hypothetical protein
MSKSELWRLGARLAAASRFLKMRAPIGSAALRATMSYARSVFSAASWWKVPFAAPHLSGWPHAW